MVDGINQLLVSSPKHVEIYANKSLQGVCGCALLTQFLSSKNIMFALHFVDHQKSNPQTDQSISIDLETSKGLSYTGVHSVVHIYKEVKHILQKPNAHYASLAITSLLQDVKEIHDKEILADAQENQYITCERTPPFVGIQTQPLAKLLSVCPLHIPNVSGSMSSAEKMLYDIGISATMGERATRYIDLTQREKQKLLHAIAKAKGTKTALTWTTYTLHHIQHGVKTKDLRECAALLDACIHMDKPSIALGLLYHDAQSMEVSHHLHEVYNKHIDKALLWYQSHKQDEQRVIQHSNAIILNAEDNIQSSIARGFTQALANQEKRTVLSLTLHQNEKVKICFGTNDVEFINDIMQKISQKMGKQLQPAHTAGLLIDKSHQQDFLQVAQELLH